MMIFYEDYESEDDNAELSTDINNNSRKNEEEDLNSNKIEINEEDDIYLDYDE